MLVPRSTDKKFPNRVSLMSPTQGEFDVLHGFDVAFTKRGATVEQNIAVSRRTLSHKRRAKGESALESDDDFAAWWGAYLRGPREELDLGASPVRFLDLYSSVGGLSLGAMEAIRTLGFRPVPLLAADVDEDALRVYRRNVRPRETVNESVRALVDFRVSGKGPAATFAYEPAIRDERLAALKGRVDLLLAGPPCQGHSTLNNHSRGNDPKNLLYLTVPAIAVALDAKHVVIENVPNVINDHSGVVESTHTLLRNNGYRISAAVLAADRLGWPQTRKRYFLVASRGSAPLELAALKQRLKRPSLPVGWALEEFLERSLDPADIMFSVPQLSDENQRRVNFLFDEDVYDLPNEIRPDCHKEGTTYGAVYGRMHWDRPAPTITGGFLSPGRGRFVHPRLRRVLTPREAARVQGFPDWFQMAVEGSQGPSRADLTKWIGDAVPPILGYTAVLAALAGEMVGEDLEQIHEHAS